MAISNSPDLQVIVHALSVVHSAASSNDARLRAQSTLEDIKNQPAAPIYGYELVVEAKEDAGFDPVRHFGLSIIAHCIAAFWATYSLDEKTQIRNWVVDIALNGLRENESHFVREKAAVVFVEVAKREWLTSWTDMDETLHRIYDQSEQGRTLALSILQAFIEDVFLLDDVVAGLRHTILSAGLLSIMCSSQVLDGHYRTFGRSIDIVPTDGNPGWLKIWSDTLVDAASQKERANILAAIKTSLSWVIPESIVECRVAQNVCGCLIQGNAPVQAVALDCLYILIYRVTSDEDPLWPIAEALFELESLDALGQVFEMLSGHLKADAGGVDETAYTVLKKLSETIMALGGKIPMFKNLSDAAYSAYVDLVLTTMEHPSLMLITMTQGFWTVTLRETPLRKPDQMITRLDRLFEIACSHLIRYEDACLHLLKNTPVAYLLEVDIEGASELHVFASNMKRFMSDILRMITYIQPVESIARVHDRFNKFFSTELDKSYRDEHGLCKKSSPAYLTVDQIFSIVDSCIRGIQRIREEENVLKIESQNSRLSGPVFEHIYNHINDWCTRLANANMEDPLIMGRQISLLVTFASFLDDNGASLIGNSMLGVILQKVITTTSYAYPAGYPEDVIVRVRELRGRCGGELIRLACAMPNILMTEYGNLQAHIATVSGSRSPSENENTVYNAFLLVISQLSSISVEEKAEKFYEVVNPIAALWSDNTFKSDISSLQSFAKFYGVQRIYDYIVSRKIDVMRDNLDNYKLDQQGLQLQEELKEERKKMWPIRAFRKFVEVSLERGLKSPDEMARSRELWAPVLRDAFPALIEITKRTHDMAHPSAFYSSPPEVQAMIQESRHERFWLHGVSRLSKDEFLEESSKTADTVKELAHTLGHVVRRTREHSYSTLAAFAMLGNPFFEMPHVAEALRDSFTQNTEGLSFHALSNMLTSVRCIITNCPAAYWPSFLPALLPALLNTLLERLRVEWAHMIDRGLVIEQEDEENPKEEDLSDEMMEECLLRHFSNSAVRLVRDLCSVSRPPGVDPHGLPTTTTLDMFCFSKPAIASPLIRLILFLMSVRDQRSSGVAIAALKSIVTVVGAPAGPGRDIEEQMYADAFRTILYMLNDAYFSAQHSTLTMILVQLYLVADSRKSAACRQVLQSIPSLAADDKVAQFHETFMRTSNKRSQKLIMWALVQSSGINDRAINGAEDRKKALARLGVADVDSKEILRRFKSGLRISEQDGRGSSNLVEQADTEEDVGLSGLFGPAAD